MSEGGTLTQFVQGIDGFTGWTHAKKIRFFAWFLHSQKRMNRFSAAQIRSCYDAVNSNKPSSINPFLQQMQKKKPPSLLKDRSGYYLEKRVRDEFEARYGKRETTIQLDQLLSDLPSKVPDLQERVFLDEALICFRHGAFRAAIVMTWNLAFDHLCNHVLNNRLSDFNTQLSKSYPKAKIGSLVSRDDFSELKEFEVLQVCKSANIVSGSLHKILDEKLKRRNIAAHPNKVTITQLQAEDFISDLVENVVVKLA